MSDSDIKAFIQRVARPETMRYANTSMKDAYGLRWIYKYFNIPFLRLQRQTLLQLISRNAEEIELTEDELRMSAITHKE